MPAFYRGFQALLHYKLIYKREYEVQQVAEHMGISASALYAYVEGERTFPVDLLPRLYGATGDPEFLEFVLRNTAFMLAPLPAAQESARCLRSETLDVAGVVGELAVQVDAAVADGKVNDRERRGIEQTVNRLHREVEEVRAKMKVTP